MIAEATLASLLDLRPLKRHLSCSDQTPTSRVVMSKLVRQIPVRRARVPRRAQTRSGTVLDRQEVASDQDTDDRQRTPTKLTQDMRALENENERRQESDEGTTAEEEADDDAKGHDNPKQRNSALSKFVRAAFYGPMGVEERSEKLQDPILRGYWVPDTSSKTPTNDQYFRPNFNLTFGKQKRGHKDVAKQIKDKGLCFSRAYLKNAEVNALTIDMIIDDWAERGVCRGGGGAGEEERHAHGVRREKLGKGGGVRAAHPAAQSLVLEWDLAIDGRHTPVKNEAARMMNVGVHYAGRWVGRR
ncbi:hypothetical protein JB92DRAFT_3103308 [Gautieria morchelliformis]|nr:hypothetical protein JB92DRAFT_3103308 [Gautieria morchelliformis]